MTNVTAETVRGDVGTTTDRTGIPSTYIGTGLLFLALVALTIGMHLADIVGPYRHNPVTLGLVHLFVLGFATTTAIGAMVQMVPVILGEPFDPSGRSRSAYRLLVPGIVSMVVGFGTWFGPLLAAGGTMVTLGVFAFTLPCMKALMAHRRSEATRLYMIAALVYLLLTVSFGVLMAIQIHWPFMPALTVRGLGFHVLLGGVGWLTTLIVGVSYKLIPMFSPSPADVDGRARTTLFFMSFGLFLLLASWFPRWMPGLGFGTAALVVALVLYVRDVVHMIRRRLRRSLGLAVGQAAVAVACLALSATAGVIVWWSALLLDGFNVVRMQRLVVSIAVIFGFGWIGGMILGMLTKILPMIVWMEMFSERVGDPDVPTIADLLAEPPARLGAWLYYSGMTMLAIGILAGWMFGMGMGAVLVVAGMLSNLYAFAGVLWARRRGWGRG